MSLCRGQDEICSKVGSFLSALDERRSRAARTEPARGFCAHTDLLMRNKQKGNIPRQSTKIRTIVTGVDLKLGDDGSATGDESIFGFVAQGFLGWTFLVLVLLPGAVPAGLRIPWPSPRAALYLFTAPRLMVMVMDIDDG